MILCGYAFAIVDKNEFYNYYKTQSKNKDQRYDVDMRVTQTMYDQDAEQSYIEHPDEEHRKDLMKRRKIDKII